MLRNVFLLLLIVLPIYSFGQGDTVFLSGTAPNYLHLSNRWNATCYRPPTVQDGERYNVNYYRMDNSLYVSAKSKYRDTILFDGLYIEYDSAGKKHEYGNYILNHKVGQWKLMRPDISKVWAATNYWLGNRDTSYEMLTFYPSGKLKRKQYLLHDSLEVGVCYNEDGTFRPFTAFQIMTDPVYDPHKVVAANLVYPNDAIRRDMHGRVLVQFVVDEKGYIKEVKAMNDAETSVAKEAVRVVKLLPPWKPALQDDVPVKMYFTIPINFRLE